MAPPMRMVRCSRALLRRGVERTRSFAQGLRGRSRTVVGDSIHPPDTKRSREVGDGRRGVDEPGRERG